MTYTCQIEIHLPIEKTILLWENEAFFKEWQDHFESITLVSGIYNTKNAKSKILFSGKRPMELLETIMVNNLPVEKTALYEHKHMSNTQTTKFVALNENKTLYISEVHYLKFNNLLIKCIAKLKPSLFKKQSQKWMQQFKTFAENH